MAGFLFGQLRNQPARIIDIESIIVGEYAENEIRKDFIVSERVSIGEAVEAELGNRQGQRTDLRPSLNLDEIRTKRTDEIAAEKAGFGNKETFRQAKLNCCINCNGSSGSEMSGRTNSKLEEEVFFSRLYTALLVST